MANSAIRIPIPGSIIDAANASDGDLLYFDSTRGQGGAFVNFRPLIQNLSPFTKNSQLDFYVSIKGEQEATNWADAVKRGMVLATALNENSPISDDIRLGINLESGRPSHNLEVVGDFMIWGAGLEAGDILGRTKFYSNNTQTPQPSPENLIFATPLKNYSDGELSNVQPSLRQGKLLLRHPITLDTYFARLEDILIPGNGIIVDGNTVSFGGAIDFSQISSPTGITLRIDSDNVGGEKEALNIVEKVALPGGGVGDFSMLRLVRSHGAEITWEGGAFNVGNSTSHGWPTIKMSVGSGSRITPSGFVYEDGTPINNLSDQDQYPNIGSYYSRLFGPVANIPTDIVITGTAGQPNTARYFDLDKGVSSDNLNGGGRFGFLQGFASMSELGGIANPGSFIGGYLNKHNDGGGLKVKACDTDGDEFALFLENGNVVYDLSTSTGSGGSLTARHLTVANNAVETSPNDQYKNVLAKDAPVFTVRATSGDTFIRGFLVMPFLPGINSRFEGKPTQPGEENGTTVFSTEIGPDESVSLIRYVWDFSANGGAGDWIVMASYTLPKGTLYCDSSGAIKVSRGGSHISNHGLNGVTSWKTSD